MYDIIKYLSILTPLTGIIIGFKKEVFKSFIFSRIFLFLIISFISDVIAYIAARLFQNNMPIFHIYGLVEVLLILFFYKRIFPNTKLYPLLIIGFTIIYVGNTVFFEPILSFNQFGQGIKCITAIIAVMYYYYRLIINSSDTIYNKSYFYISVGIVLYYSVSIYSYLFAIVLHNYETETRFNIWIIHNSLNILKNLFIAYGFWNIQTNVKN